MNPIVKKICKIALIALASLLALFLLLWAGLWVARAIVYADYIQNKETVCKIPGMNEGFVPQGLTQDGADRYIFTGYTAETNEMAIYVSDKGEAREVIPVDPDGKRWAGHGGRSEERV